MKYQSTSEYILETSREYAIYVCDQRAIPLVTDGLKSSQRKMLWLMRNRADKLKTVSLAGQSIADGLYLHGDSSASQTISMMAAPYCNNIPLLTGVGSFGTIINPQAWGAPRYTYVKRNRAAEKILYQDLDVVPMKENYDGSTTEPVTFLPIIPLVLLNGVSGIAVGWSTEILPHSLKDIVDAVALAIQGKKIKQLEPHYSYLDIDVRHLGGNSWEFLGKVEKKDGSSLRVTSLPPDLSLEKFRERLDQYEDEDKINTYTDNSSDKIDIEIKFKRGTIADWSEEKLVEFLKLRSRKSERIVVIGFDNNSIKQYSGPEELVKDFVEWRFGFYVKRYEKFFEDASYELHYWLALRECFDHKLPDDILKVKNKKEVIDKIFSIADFIDEKQADKIANLPTYRWCTEYYEEVLKKIEELLNNIEEYADLLENPEKIRTIFLDEVKALKKEKL